MMRVVILLAVLLAALPAHAGGGRGTLTVNLTGFRNDDGLAMVSVFKSAEGFPYETRQAAARGAFLIRGGKAVAVFADLAHGEYAAAVFHDEDMSGRLPRNLLGIPQKGHGLSNMPQGLPDFKKSAFTLDSPEKSVEIRIQY